MTIFSRDRHDFCSVVATYLNRNLFRNDQLRCSIETCLSTNPKKLECRELFVPCKNDGKMRKGLTCRINYYKIINSP